MNILYFHQYFNTPNASGGLRSYEFASRWAAAGHNVVVVTGIRNDPTLKPGWQTVKGVRVRCVGARYNNQFGFTARIMSFLAYALMATWHAMRSGRYDIVLATSTPLTVAVPALAAKWIARRKMVFEVRDVWPDAAIEAGVLKNRFLIACARKLESLVYRHSDHIVPLSTGMAANIRAKGVPDKKLTMLPNCSDTHLFDPSRFDRAALRAALGAGDRFVVLYVGAISLANDMPFLVETMRATRRDDRLRWWFVGGGNRLDYLKKEVAGGGISNVVFWGRQPKAEVPRFVAAADVGVVSFINEPVYYENSPNKFFDYCAGGLPSIFTRTTWLQPYMDKYDAGMVCAGNRTEEFVAGLIGLVNNPARRDIMGSNARRMAEAEFSRATISGKYIDLLEKVAGREGQAGVAGMRQAKP